MNEARLIASLVVDEGIRLKVYDDATGKPIVPGSVVIGHPTIGIGRALDTKGCTEQEAYQWCSNDIEEKKNGLVAGIDFWPQLDDVRQNVLIEMAFQMGVTGLLAFHGMLGAMKAQDWRSAADAGLDSAWARETSARARKLMTMLASGAWS